MADEAVKLAKHYTLFMGSLEAVVKINMLNKLLADEIYVVNLKSVADSPRMQKVTVVVEDLSAVGIMCLDRARLNAKRRYCGRKERT